MTLVIQPRSAWVPPGPAVTGPARRQPFQRGAIHWEGVNRDRTPADIAAHIRAMHRSWVNSRGYSLGYGFCVVSDVRHPLDGSCWEVRGFDLNMASNPGRTWAGTPRGNASDWTGSVLIIGPTAGRASQRAAATIRALFAEWHSRANTAPQRPLPHSALDATACCGDPYRLDLNAGLFDPAATPTPPPTNPATEIEMIALDWQPNTPNWTAFAWTGTHLSHVVDGHADNVMRAAGVGRQTVSDAALLGIIRSSSKTSGAPSTLTPEMAAAW